MKLIRPYWIRIQNSVAQSYDVPCRKLRRWIVAKKVLNMINLAFKIFRTFLIIKWFNVINFICPISVYDIT